MTQSNRCIAYRCPHCGQTVLGTAQALRLSGELVKLKCACGQSVMTILRRGEQFTLEVPCLFCPTPHTYTVQAPLLEHRSLFELACPYSALQICLAGEEEAVLERAKEVDVELQTLLKEAGVADFSTLRQLEAEQEESRDPQVDSIVALTVENLQAEGKIFCNCKIQSDQEIQFEFLADSLLLYCKKCGATRMFGVSNLTTALAFMDIDEISCKDTP